MKKLFNCEIQYYISPHLSQIYDGFEKLRRNGFINLTQKLVDGNPSYPILRVVLDNTIKVDYDLMDSNSTRVDINFEQYSIPDFYFKRSYNDEIKQKLGNNCNCYPLGLNYPMNADFNDNILKKRLKNSYIYKFIRKGEVRYPSEIFESLPLVRKENKIIFFTRLWDPSEVSTPSSKEFREQENNVRINLVKLLKNEYGKQFIGGVTESKYSNKICNDIVVPLSSTLRANYLNLLKQSNIAITTTGLYDSIGWKLGEYVAASKSIITTPLNFSLPGNFMPDRNYLEYSGTDDIINSINKLCADRTFMEEMMYSNYRYYNNFVKSDRLVLNTLLKIKNYISS